MEIMQRDNRIQPYDDDFFMNAALAQAKLAYEKGEVPIGAVMVARGQIIARGHNMTEQLTDATAHAEMITLTAASEALGSKYLRDCTLYVTLEPCPMCAAALKWAQLGRIVYGAADEKSGYLRISEGLLHPKTEIEQGVLAKESLALMQAFFRARRSESKK